MTVTRLCVIAMGLWLTGQAQVGHYVEIDGTVSIEAEEYILATGGGQVRGTPPQSGIPAPLSGSALYFPCTARQNFSVKWRVTFETVGTYQVWILGWGNDNAADNFGVFLGPAPGPLRPMNARQNCSYNTNPGCPNYEASVTKGGSTLGWSRNQQCIASRGCSGNVTTWTISQPGTYEIGIHNGDEPFYTHEDPCPGSRTPHPYIVVDKIVITTSGATPVGAGPPATRADGVVADFSFSGSGPAPALIAFNASASSAVSGSITGYQWEFGDGSSGSGVSVQHTFVQNKSYTVRLTVTSSEAKSATVTKTVVIADPSQFSVRINAGSTVAGHGFEADNSYEGGSAVVSQGQAVSGTDMDEVFSSVRHQNFAYRIPVPAAGEYSVELLFAEFWRDPGQRVFRAEIEGISTPDIDIAAAVGRGAAHSVASTVTVSDGVLDIAFVPVSDDNPMVSALSVTAASTATDTRGLHAQAWSNSRPLAMYRLNSYVVYQGAHEGDILVVSSLNGRTVLRRRLGDGQGSVCMPVEAASVLLCHIERNGSRVQAWLLP